MIRVFPRAFVEISRCFTLINEDKSIHSVVLSSSTPGVFCSGIDCKCCFCTTIDLVQYLKSLLVELNSPNMDGGTLVDH